MSTKLVSKIGSRSETIKNSPYTLKNLICELGEFKYDDLAEESRKQLLCWCKSFSRKLSTILKKTLNQLILTSARLPQSDIQWYQSRCDVLDKNLYVLDTGASVLDLMPAPTAGTNDDNPTVPQGGDRNTKAEYKNIPLRTKQRQSAEIGRGKNSKSTQYFKRVRRFSYRNYRWNGYDLKV